MKFIIIIIIILYYFVLVDKCVYVLILLDKLRCKILS